MADYSSLVKEFLVEGKKIETQFANDLIIELGGDIKSASENDDKYKHIDVYWKPLDKELWYSFDVKALKKNNRSDNDISLENTWLEIKNVYGGPGSLLGQAHYMAFEYDKSWLIVRRKELLDKLRKSIFDKTVYKYNPNSNFKLYPFSKLNDSIFPMSFIIENVNKIIKKH